MVSAYTPNLNLEEPARGDQVGVWDTPENANWTLADLVVGGTVTIGLNNANVVLNAAQFQCEQITFNSTLTGSVTITFPSSFKKPYTIQNVCTGSSAFFIRLATASTAATAQAISCPPGIPFEIRNDGTNIAFKSFGPPIGGYWDYAGSSLPIWVANCTVPPYLLCDGSAFSAATYPALAIVLGSTTLPDFRGRAPLYLNQGTGRINSSNCGIDGNTLGAAGGSEFMQIHSHANSLNDPTHTHTSNGWSNAGGGYHTAGGGDFAWGPETINAAATGMSITNANAGSGFSQNMPPSVISGLRLVRAG